MEGPPMREQEMRMRVFRFLKARMRNMIMPATVGIGLAAGGCHISSSAVYEAPWPPEDASTSKSDVLGADSTTPGSDVAMSGSDVAGSGADLAASSPEAQKVDAVADVSRVPVDASDARASTDLVVAVDGAGLDVGRADATPAGDAATDLGSTVTKYLAPQPDAAPEVGRIAPDYIAQIPDASSVAPVYMAPLYMPVKPS